MRKSIAVTVLGTVAVLGPLLGTLAPAEATSGENIDLKVADCHAVGAYHNLFGGPFYMDTYVVAGGGCWVSQTIFYHNYSTNSSQFLSDAGFERPSHTLYTQLPCTSGDPHFKTGCVGIYATFILCEGDGDSRPCVLGKSIGVPDHFNW